STVISNRAFAGVAVPANDFTDELAAGGPQDQGQDAAPGTAADIADQERKSVCPERHRTYNPELRGVVPKRVGASLSQVEFDFCGQPEVHRLPILLSRLEMHLECGSVCFVCQAIRETGNCPHLLYYPILADQYPHPHGTLDPVLAGNLGVGRPRIVQ